MFPLGLQAEGNADDVSARDLEDMLEPFGNGRVILKKVTLSFYPPLHQAASRHAVA